MAAYRFLKNPGFAPKPKPFSTGNLVKIKKMSSTGAASIQEPQHAPGVIDSADRDC